MLIVERPNAKATITKGNDEGTTKVGNTISVLKSILCIWGEKSRNFRHFFFSNIFFSSHFIIVQYEWCTSSIWTNRRISIFVVRLQIFYFPSFSLFFSLLSKTMCNIFIALRLNIIVFQTFSSLFSCVTVHRVFVFVVLDFCHHSSHCLSIHNGNNISDSNVNERSISFFFFFSLIYLLLAKWIYGYVVDRERKWCTLQLNIEMDWPKLLFIRHEELSLKSHQNR